VKTRGYRVELDEIEVAMLSHPDVQEAAVYTVSDGEGSTLIEGAVVPKPDTSLTSEALSAFLHTKLVPYAVPVKLMVLPEFPRTSTGKINRRELQAMSVTAVA